MRPLAQAARTGRPGSGTISPGGCPPQDFRAPAEVRIFFIGQVRLQDRDPSRPPTILGSERLMPANSPASGGQVDTVSTARSSFRIALTMPGLRDSIPRPTPHLSRFASQFASINLHLAGNAAARYHGFTGSEAADFLAAEGRPGRSAGRAFARRSDCWRPRSRISASLYRICANGPRTQAGSACRQSISHFRPGRGWQCHGASPDRLAAPCSCGRWRSVARL